MYIFCCCLSLERGLGGGERGEKAPQGLLTLELFLEGQSDPSKEGRLGWGGERSLQERQTMPRKGAWQCWVCARALSRPD